MKKSFSLIEVLVFVTVLGLFFVAAISITTFNLKNMKIQEHKIIATRYAEEGVEWLKQQKEDGWTDFIAKGSSAGTHYCLNSLGWSITIPPTCNYGLGTIYERELLIKDSGETIMTVSWQDMGTDLSVRIPTVFKLLE